jgi:hypothetical protein
MFSTLAGFVEPGETLEQAVKTDPGKPGSIGLYKSWFGLDHKRFYR